MGKICGKQSIYLENDVYIEQAASVVGSKEAEGPLGGLFDLVAEDDCFSCDNWEDAESTFQKKAVDTLLQKAEEKKENVRFLLAGDLLGQSIASSFGLMDYQIPLYGLYGACSTCGLSLNLGAAVVNAGYAERVICVTSSHYASAEKEFRFPLSYGNQRPLSAGWTVTGSGAFLLGTQKGALNVKISGVTTGKIVDYGIKDSMNMGSCMAPAAADTILANLKDFSRNSSDYDKIITGDLGMVGSKLLKELLQKEGVDISKNHMDCGIEIYDASKQDTHNGGSGCGCAAVVLASYILRQLDSGKWKRILFLPTGALLSKVSFNEGRTIPGIAHAIVLESAQ